MEKRRLVVLKYSSCLQLSVVCSCFFFQRCPLATSLVVDTQVIYVGERLLSCLRYVGTSKALMLNSTTPVISVIELLVILAL